MKTYHQPYSEQQLPYEDPSQLYPPFPAPQELSGETFRITPEPLPAPQ